MVGIDAKCIPMTRRFALYFSRRVALCGIKIDRCTETDVCVCVSVTAGHVDTWVHT